MKALLISTAAVACLLTVSDAAYSQDAVQAAPSETSQSSAQPSAAAAAAQTGDSSFGGMSTTGTQAGSRSPYGTPCVIGLSCDIYKGN